MYNVEESGKKWVTVERRSIFRRSAYIQKVEIMFNGFSGRHLHTIDEKGRITFPSSLRESLGENPVILSGFDGNLLIMSSLRFDQLSEKIYSQNMADVNSRRLRRLIFSTATPIEFDKNGRFIIPQPLREIASLDGAALVMGVGKDIEVWNPDLYKEQEETNEGTASAADLVSNFDLTF